MSQISKSPSYFIRNRHSYCFRMTVPADLRPLIGKRELRFSLQTGYLKTQIQEQRFLPDRFSYYSGDGEEPQRLHETERPTNPGYGHDIPGTKQGVMDQPFGTYDGDRPFDDFASLTVYINGLDEVKKDILAEMATGKYWRVKDDASATLGIWASRGKRRLMRQAQPTAWLYSRNLVSRKARSMASPAYIKLCEWLLRAQIKELQYHKNRLSGGFSDNLEHALDAVLKTTRSRHPMLTKTGNYHPSRALEQVHGRNLPLGNGSRPPSRSSSRAR